MLYEISCMRTLKKWCKQLVCPKLATFCPPSREEHQPSLHTRAFAPGCVPPATSRRQRGAGHLRLQDDRHPLLFICKEETSCGTQCRQNCQCRRQQRSIPGSGRSPGVGDGNPLQHCLENPMDRGACFFESDPNEGPPAWCPWSQQRLFRSEVMESFISINIYLYFFFYVSILIN